jgi:hypothetical protein
MARDINGASRDYIGRLDVLIAVFAGTFVLYAGLVAYPMYRIATYSISDGEAFTDSGSYTAVLLVLASLLFAVPAYLVERTAGFLKLRGRPALGGFTSVLLFMCYGISLPVLQAKLNEEWKARPSNAVDADPSP